MPPDTVITYDNNLQMTIAEGGYSSAPMAVNTSADISLEVPPLPEGLSADQENSFIKLQQDIQANIDKGESNHYPVAYPYPGEKVVYSSDGYVQHCYFPDANEPTGYTIHLPADAAMVASITTTKHWGSYSCVYGSPKQ